MRIRKGMLITALTLAVGAPVILFAGADDPPQVADDYIISFGPRLDAIPGDPAFFLPIKVSLARPTARIYLYLTYDPATVTPTLLAPNIFVQGFTYDLSMSGKMKVTLITDLPPPPDVAPILGDTTVAWIMFRITTRYIGYDFLTHIGYFDDPGTPAGDNFIVLADNTIITPPALTLDVGDILVRLPNYGDINLNTYTYEIADAVAFLNFFMGAPFNRQQYANADCNHDGVQATISDLVFLLRVISYDSLTSGYPAEIFSQSPAMRGTEAVARPLLSSEGSCNIVVESQSFIGGATLTLKLWQGINSLEEIYLSPGADRLNLAYAIDGEFLKIAVVDWTGRANSFNGGPMLGIRYSGDTPPTIVSSEFSDALGSRIDAVASIDCGCREIGVVSTPPAISISGYPNPFNSITSINMSLPADGHYELSIFDILGRRVRNLLNEYRPAGSNDILWDGADENGTGVTSGTYFVRLTGDSGSSTIKLQLLK